MTEVSKVNANQNNHAISANKSTKTNDARKNESNESSIGKLLVDRTAAIVMTPIIATAGVFVLGGKSVEGLVTNKPYNQAMQEGIEAAVQGADMLDKMWNGKFF